MPEDVARPIQLEAAPVTSNNQGDDDNLPGSSPNQLEYHECRGEVVFSGKLYHGTATNEDTPPHIGAVDYRQLYLSPLKRDNNFDIEDATLGAGFYLCDNVQRAIRYADWKKRQLGENPYLLSIEVTDMPLYDFRDLAHPDQNGMVPLEMMEKWQQYFTQNKDKILAFATPNVMTTNQLNEYEWQLNNLLEPISNLLN